MNVDAMLRRIDDEITQHNQEIAARQVAIMRLQDTRKVLMGLAEGDQIAAEEAKLQRGAAQLNGHSAPMLIVRRIGSGDDEAPAPKKSKNKKPRNYEREREAAAELQRKRDQGAVPPPKKRGPPKPRESLKYDTAERWGGAKALEDKIAALVAKTGPIQSREIGNRMGFEQGSIHRQPLSNALWALKKNGRLQRDDNNLYTVVRP